MGSSESSAPAKDQTFVNESKKESQSGRGILKDRRSTYKSKGSSRSSSSSSSERGSSFYGKESDIRESVPPSEHDIGSPGVPDERVSVIGELKKDITKVKDKLDESVNNLSYNLKKYNVEKHPELGDDFTLFLDCENNLDGVTNFLRASKHLGFESLRKVRYGEKDTI